MEVSRTLPYGFLKVVEITGVALDTTIELKPAAGFSWLVVEAWGYHDDATSRSLNWQFQDDNLTLGIVKEGSGAIAALSPWHLPQRSTSTPWATNIERYLFNSKVYAQLNADALAAGKKLYIKALVYELGDS